MNAHLLNAGQPVSFEPLTVNRPLATCPVANISLREAQEQELCRAGFSLAHPRSDEVSAVLRGDAWCDAKSLTLLRERTRGAIRDKADGTPLAWIGIAAHPPPPTSDDLIGEDCFLLRHPWDLLRVNEFLLRQIERSRIEGTLSPAAHVEGTLVLGEHSVVLPGVYVEGVVLVGRNTRIGPNAFLRGYTTIGDNCRIGQAVEVKNSIVMAGTTIAHLSYCGDSILGERVNLGGGTIIANLRHDNQPVPTHLAGRLVSTGRRKCGAVLGDGVHTGIHTSLYPGRKLWPGTTTRPGETVSRDLLPAERS